MKRKLFLLTAIILSLSLFLSACGQKDIGEAKAKQIALEAFQNVFDVDETDAMMDSFEQVAMVNRDGKIVQPNDGKAEVYYTATVTNENGETLYYAEVNAKTGSVYLVQQNPAKLVLTPEQMMLATSPAAQDVFAPTKTNRTPRETALIAQQWVLDRYESGQEPETLVIQSTYTDSMQYPNVSIDTDIFWKDGNSYRVTVCWPTMEITGVYFLGQVS